MSPRKDITMSEAEIQAFLAEEQTVICATIGKDGWPHLMPLWYVVRDGEIWSWTFAKSQKARNLERDARCTLQVEAGETYDQLRGVMLKAECEVHRDVETVAALGRELFTKHSGGQLPDATAAMVDKQAPKRIAMHFRTRETATWDHRKLGEGVY